MTIEQIASELKKHKSILIFSHNRPDGDTIGSATALRLALIKLNIDADLVCFGDIPEKLKYINSTEFYSSSINTSKNYSAYIAVDCSCEYMFPELYVQFSKHRETFNVDHHISNTRYAKYNFVLECGACAELVYSLIKALGVEIDSEIATCLLTGIVTDTGAFYHSNVTEQTLLIASHLKKSGGDLQLVIKKNFKEQSKERAKLYARVISKMRYRLDGKVGVLIITKEDLDECNAVANLTEGFIDYPMTIDGVEVALSFLETGKNRYKVSLRSKGKVNVNEIASLYGGGGHVLASGMIINGHIEDVIDKLCYNVEQRL